MSILTQIEDLISKNRRLNELFPQVPLSKRNIPFLRFGYAMMEIEADLHGISDKYHIEINYKISEGVVASTHVTLKHVDDTLLEIDTNESIGCYLREEKESVKAHATNHPLNSYNKYDKIDTMTFFESPLIFRSLTEDLIAGFVAKNQLDLYEKPSFQSASRNKPSAVYVDREQKSNSLRLFDLVVSGKQKQVQTFIQQLEDNGKKFHEAIHPVALVACINSARRNNHPRIAEAIMSAIAEEERAYIVLMSEESLATGLRV